MPIRDSQSSYLPTATARSPSIRASARQYSQHSQQSDRPFQYSTAGPPTVYSQIDTSWSQPSQYPTQTPAPGRGSIPPLPSPPPNATATPNKDDQDDLYHRSDWEEEPKTSATGWSHSSWAGPTTQMSGRLSVLKEDEEWNPPTTAPPYHQVEYVLDQNGIMDSPGEMTPGFVARDSLASPAQPLGRPATLPSILELDHLTQPPVPKPFPSTPPTANPFVDPNHTYKSNSSGSPKLISTEAQQRLGRMSMATARYTLPPQRERGLKFPFKQSSADTLPPLLARSAPGRYYLTYRPFILPLLTLTCALTLTVASSSAPSSVGMFVQVAKGVFKGAEGGGNGAGSEIGLGAWGWCQIGVKDAICNGYNQGDFKNESGSFTIPGTSSLSNLSLLLTTLTCLTWLLASFQTISAFLHFYLFFALSIPFNHLIATPADERVEKEVDLRVKAERGVYGEEGEYTWVWWSWWGHWRGPVGWFFGLLVGSLSFAMLGAVVMFKRAIEDGTKSTDVHYGTGTLVPVMTFVLTADTFVTSVFYFVRVNRNIKTFMNPPDPSPAALLLPSTSQKMQHIRQTQGSFFAPREPTLPPDSSVPFVGGYGEKGVWHDPDAPPLPKREVELDPETVRWLAAYPGDEELVSLISDLRMGRLNDDFLLSDVGLLYLRPISDDEQALLVPPQGVIRNELIEDAHMDVSVYGEQPENGQAAHNEAEIMVETLGDTFWWNGLAKQCVEYVEQCKVCRERRRVEEIEERAGMTAVPWTGVTGWTHGTEVVGESEMAAEMAFAMRKAQEDADKTKLV
nr:hypothetical protein L203_03882 [Cryptococcus depauperatus CBS 7841]